MEPGPFDSTGSLSSAEPLLLLASVLPSLFALSLPPGPFGLAGFRAVDNAAIVLPALFDLLALPVELPSSTGAVLFPDECPSIAYAP